MRGKAGGIEFNPVLCAPYAAVAGNRRARDSLRNDRSVCRTPVRAPTPGHDAVPDVDLELAEGVLGPIVREPRNTDGRRAGLKHAPTGSAMLLDWTMRLIPALYDLMRG